jgi:hypothetical protein
VKYILSTLPTISTMSLKTILPIDMAV